MSMGMMGQAMKQKKSVWLKIVLGIAIVVFCFLPLIPVSYEVVVERHVSEEYTTLEPYTVQEEVREPYTAVVDQVVWESGKPRLEQIFVTKWRTVIKDVTKYREVTKTRLVYRPVVETRTKRVSILRYLLR